MITQSAGIGRLFLLNRSLVNSTSFLGSKSTFSKSRGFNLTTSKNVNKSLHKKSLEWTSFSHMHTSSNLCNTDGQKDQSKPQFSSELQEIISKKEAKEANPSNEEDPKSEDEKKGRLANAFSREHGWKVTLALFGGIFTGGAIYALFAWGAPNMDENNKPIKDEYSDLPMITQYPRRAFNAVCNYYSAMKEPSTDKLLPAPLQYPYLQPTYTLVIEMTGLLLHPEWTFNTGWRYKKRPGLDYFLEQIKYPTFEVVLFTREPFLSGHPIVTNLDPQNQIQFRLFRESTNLKNNHYVKDLSFMNRDMNKIIVIDWDEDAYELQPRNALHRLKKWEGEDSDTDLVYLASFLKMIASSGVADVREVLDYYNKEVDPLDTFKINQVKLHEAELKRQQEIDEMKKSKQQNKPAAFSFFRR